MNELAVVVDSVGFSYTKNRPVLRDVSIHVPKGKCILISNIIGVLLIIVF